MIATALLISIVHIVWPFMCQPIDLYLEISHPEWYKRNVTWRRFSFFLLFMHFLGACVTAFTLPFMLSSLHMGEQNRTANASGAGNTSANQCPAEKYVQGGLPLYVQVFEYLLLSTLGNIQCISSSVKSCRGGSDV
jgi:hypothetical protein